jgi:hypothetical protein
MGDASSVNLFHCKVPIIGDNIAIYSRWPKARKPYGHFFVQISYFSKWTFFNNLKRTRIEYIRKHGKRGN